VFGCSYTVCYMMVILRRDCAECSITRAINELPTRCWCGGDAEVCSMAFPPAGHWFWMALVLDGGSIQLCATGALARQAVSPGSVDDSGGR